MNPYKVCALSDKPDPEDLQHFLEFQVPLQWAPLFNELILGPQKRKGSYPSLQFRFLGPKLQVSTSQVLDCYIAQSFFLKKISSFSLQFTVTFEAPLCQ
jgi:hypothetical protein